MLLKGVSIFKPKSTIFVDIKPHFQLTTKFLNLQHQNTKTTEEKGSIELCGGLQVLLPNPKPIK